VNALHPQQYFINTQALQEKKIMGTLSTSQAQKACPMQETNK